MFVWYDYLILVIVLLSSTLIGIYFGYFAKKPLTAKEYLSGEKRMKILPVAISVTVGHFSAILVVGVTADVYKYGAFFFLRCLSVIFVVCVAIFVIYPLLFKRNVSSIFEYLEQRFDRKTRLLGSLLYILYESLVLLVVIYSPALALSVVTGINLQLISAIISGICILYTAIGGLRTVIWTDLLQFVIIMISLGIICGIGAKSAGGVSEVWKIALKGERLDIFDFDLDPTKKDSFWIVTFGSFAYILYFFGLSHSSVQKYLSLPTQRDCTKALIVFGICMIMVSLAGVFLGLIVYAIYATCDPVLSHQVEKHDQIVPYYVEQVSKKIPGISGLFMTALVSAGISSLSSTLNALSGVIYNDFISYFVRNDVKEKFKVKILKSIVVVLGVLYTCLASIVPYLGAILPVVVGSRGLMDGPSIGIFILGVFFPKVDSNGAFYGGICGMLFVASIYVPSRFPFFNKDISYSMSKPLSTNGCSSLNLTIFKKFDNHLNYTNILTNTTNITASGNSKSFSFFQISYHYYCLIGAIVTIILGLIFSCVGKLWNTRNRNQQLASHVRKEDDKIYEREMQPFIT